MNPSLIQHYVNTLFPLGNQPYNAEVQNYRHIFFNIKTGSKLQGLLAGKINLQTYHLITFADGHRSFNNDSAVCLFTGEVLTSQVDKHGAVNWSKSTKIFSLLKIKKLKQRENHIACGLPHVDLCVEDFQSDSKVLAMAANLAAEKLMSDDFVSLFPDHTAYKLQISKLFKTCGYAFKSFVIPPGINPNTDWQQWLATPSEPAPIKPGGWYVQTNTLPVEDSEYPYPKINAVNAAEPKGEYSVSLGEMMYNKAKTDMPVSPKLKVDLVLPDKIQRMVDVGLIISLCRDFLSGLSTSSIRAKSFKMFFVFTGAHRGCVGLLDGTTVHTWMFLDVVNRIPFGSHDPIRLGDCDGKSESEYDDVESHSKIKVNKFQTVPIEYSLV